MTGWRRLSIQLPIDDYATLQRSAARDERSPDRQAAWLLRRTLTKHRPPVAPPAPPVRLAAPPPGGTS